MAIYIWHDRIIDFLKRMTEVQDCGKKRGDSGGKTRDYLLHALQKPTVKSALGVLSLCYLSIYVPMLAKLKHLDGGIRQLTEVCPAYYKKVLNLAADPGPLLRGEFKLYAEYENKYLEAKLKTIADDCWKDGEPEESFVRLLKETLRAVAGEWHHHTLEWQTEMHVEEGEEGFAAAKKEWEKRGAKHHHKEEWQWAKAANVQATNCLAERVFGIKNYLDNLTNGCLRPDRLEGAVLNRYNDIDEYFLDKIFGLLPGKERSTYTRGLKKTLSDLVREHNVLVGNYNEQRRRMGVIQKDIDDAKIKVARARAAEAARKLEALRQVNILETLDGLKALTCDQLKDQVRAWKFVRKADVMLSESMKSKRTLLSTLCLLLGITPSAAAMDAALKRKARASGASRKRSRTPSTGMWDVDHIAGAVTVDGVRKYIIIWKRAEGADEDEDDGREWLVTYDDLLVDDDGEATIHAHLEQQVAEFDAVSEEDLGILAAMAERVNHALAATLAAGDRVLVDLRERGWARGEVVSANANGLTEVLVDGAASATRFLRNDLLTCIPAEDLQGFSEGACVRVAFSDDNATLTEKRWYYGRITSIDERKELCTIDFDNGEDCTCPLYQVDLVKPACAAPQRRGRGGRGAGRA